METPHRHGLPRHTSAETTTLTTPLSTPFATTPSEIGLPLPHFIHDMPMCSPSLANWLEHPSSVKSVGGSEPELSDSAEDEEDTEDEVNTQAFCWSIEQLAHLLPADIDEHSTQYIDPEVQAAGWTPRRRLIWQRRKLKAEREIERFFDPSHRIAPSPWAAAAHLSTHLGTRDDQVSGSEWFIKTTVRDEAAGEGEERENFMHNHGLEESYNQGNPRLPIISFPSMRTWSPPEPNVHSPSYLRAPASLSTDGLNESASDSFHQPPHYDSSGIHSEGLLDCSSASVTSLCRRLFDCGFDGSYSPQKTLVDVRLVGKVAHDKDQDNIWRSELPGGSGKENRSAVGGEMKEIKGNVVTLDGGLQSSCSSEHPANNAPAQQPQSGLSASSSDNGPTTNAPCSKHVPLSFSFQPTLALPHASTSTLPMSSFGPAPNRQPFFTLSPVHPRVGQRQPLDFMSEEDFHVNDQLPNISPIAQRSQNY